MKNSMSLANGAADNSKTVYANRCSECKKVVIDKRLIMEIPMASSNILYYCGKIVGGIYVDNKEFLEKLLRSMYEELPAQKKKK